MKLAYEHWAHWVCEDKMIRTADAARGSSSRWRSERDLREKELAELAELRTTIQAERVEPWQSRHLMERVKKSRFQFDSQSVRPYFAYQVIDGVLATTESLYGVEVRGTRPSRSGTSAPARDVLEGGELARFYLDMFPREGKFKHAAMFNLVGGVRGETLPQAALVCNFPEPKDGDPALLLHDQVTTIFHEFGHLLHHLFAVQPWGRFAGIGCEWDFVEVPSQLYEEWAWSAGVLQRFATHHETGEPIPDRWSISCEPPRSTARASASWGRCSTRCSRCRSTIAIRPRSAGDLLGRLQKEMTFERVPGPRWSAPSATSTGTPRATTYMWSLVTRGLLRSLRRGPHGRRTAPLPRGRPRPGGPGRRGHGCGLPGAPVAFEAWKLARPRLIPRISG